VKALDGATAVVLTPLGLAVASRTETGWSIVSQLWQGWGIDEALVSAVTPGGLFISNVWENRVALATPGEVYLVDLDTGARTNLSNHPADQTEPALHEDRVAWKDFRHAAAGFGYSRVFDV
jgi:hypothetical protein